ncbi:hypothetical protein NUU61_000387 [Penicillium alfredii]|uniref:Letm1 RBD domain-containing protein n=1 Tax=Penicillium alfredii TaxID=1506179 RepID=A0A9W9KR10_9EURO|nr:uncharacterized protein NUU61_000387 [Penicillium alfredii]KAJ5114628.1 hypothetical protein NUU61_000387 [Penicillium alfredii]
MSAIARGPRALQVQLRPLAYFPISCHFCAVSSQLFSTSAPTRQSRRHAPSSVPSTSINSKLKSLRHEINPPKSTLPADLDLPPPSSTTATSSDKLKRYVALGRAYLAFYKTGLKNVFGNYRASIPLRKELGLPAFLPISPPRRASAPTSPSSSSLSAGTSAPIGLSRAQFQLVRRSARDVRRMIPFTVILIVCGEFTPLIVPIVGAAITPATCRIPSQVAKERATAATRKSAALTAHATAVDGSLTPAPAGSDDELRLLATRLANPGWAATAESAAVQRACAVFGLVKHHNQRAGSLLVAPVYRSRLVRHLEYLALDDGMIRAEGGVSALDAVEVRIAVEERGGVDVAAGARDSARAEELDRLWLERWLTIRENETAQTV